MTTPMKLALVAVAALGGLSGAGALCSLCGSGVQAVSAQQVARRSQASDTATVRLHISGMTCGSCPVTARIALQRLPGVFGATVTLDDSLGVVRYERGRVTPAQIAAHLTRLTGYGARVIAGNVMAPRGGGGDKP